MIQPDSPSVARVPAPPTFLVTLPIPLTAAAEVTQPLRLVPRAVWRTTAISKATAPTPMLTPMMQVLSSPFV